MSEEDGGASIRQSMIQSENAEKMHGEGGEDGDKNSLQPVFLGKFAFDWLSNAFGHALTAFTFPLAKLEGLLFSLELKSLSGFDLVSALKKALSLVHGSGMPHSADGNLGGSDFSNSVAHSGEMLNDNGVHHQEHHPSEQLGQLHPSQLASILKHNEQDRHADH